MRKNVILSLLLILVCSCRTSEKINYFQDVVLHQPEVMQASSRTSQDIVLQPQDQITITVSSKEPELAALFNISRPQSAGSGGNSLLGYTLNDAGDIDFPVLGTLHVAGLNKHQVAMLIKKKLMDDNLVKDPVVTVEFMNLTFNVLGEVGSPGQYKIEKNRITLLDALSQAGDLTIHGKRDAIYVIRDEDGNRVTHVVDIRHDDFFDSPVYYLKQNDVVYVQPNKVRAGQSTVNDNSLKSISFWMGLVSFFMSLGVLIFN